jgi:hypothetical protein
VEEAGVKGLEDLVEVVVMANVSEDAFAAAGLTDVLGLFGDDFGGDVAAVAVGVGAGDGLLVELGKEDVGDGVVDGLGCRFEEIGEAYVQAAFAQADGGVEGGEAAEANVERGDWSAGTQFAVLMLEDGDEGGGYLRFFCARLSGFWAWLGVRRGGFEECWVDFLEERGRWHRRRGKELQELTQR